MLTSGKKAEIIERFVGHCQCSTHMPLGFLEADEEVYSCPLEAAEVVSSLTEDFSIEDLLDSGILAAAEDEAVALAPALTGIASFVVMRDAVTHQPYELLTREGCLSGEALPVFEILRDGRTQHLMENGTGELFVTFDLEQVVMLRACGLPATLAVRLDDLPLEHVDRFCESFGVTCSRSDRIVSREEIEDEQRSQSEYHPEDPIRRMMRDRMNGDGGDAGKAANCSAPSSAEGSAIPIKAQLVFVGWTPVEISNAVPLRLKPVVDHLYQLQRFMGVELHDIGLWEVNDETIERLRFIAERSSSAIFKEAMLDAAESSGASIMQFGKGKALAIVPPNDYTTALARLVGCSSEEGGNRMPGPNLRNEAWRHVQRLLSHQVVGPLRELALASTNPIERNLLMSFAELSNVFHLQSVVMGEQLSRRIADRGIESGGQLPEDQFKNLMAMADRLIGLAKATEKCNQPRTTVVESSIINSPSFPRLPHSG
jgi:hypothetical protein